MAKITGILVNTEKRTVTRETITKGLEGYYAALNCDCIDIVTRKIDGVYYDIICDDEGLLKANPIVSALSPTRQPMLVGNLFIVKFDGNDDVRSLTDAECAHILRCVSAIRIGKNLCPVIHPCDY